MTRETRTRPCPQCGETLLATADVCRACGSDVDPLAEATPAGVVVGDDPTLAASPEGTRWGMVAVTIIIVVLVVVLAILLVA